MSAFLDVVRFTASAGGTTDFTISGAVTGYQTPASAGAVNGTTYSYRAESSDLSQWEIGIGTYSTTGPTLARTTVLASSTGSKVSFTVAPQVGIVALAEDLQSKSITQTANTVWAGPTSGSAAAPGFRALVGADLPFAAPPQGRLTLVTATPVLTSDQTAKTTIYYTPYTGRYYACYDGAKFNMRPIAELSVALDTTNFLSGKLYDLFLYNDAGTDRLGYGPAWTNDTTRSAAITQLTGVWVNSATVTLRYDSTHTTSVAANQATYVGTTLATANGQTGMMFAPTAAAGGTANILGLYNAYNRVQTVTQGHDTGGGGWSYTGGGVWRPSDNSTSNSITFVDGLQQSFITAQFSQQMATASSAVLGVIGINLDATTGGPSGVLGGNSNGTSGSAFSQNTFTPVLGRHVLTMMEMTSGGSATFFGYSAGSPYQGYFAQLEM